MNIQEILESLPTPGGEGLQINLFQNRNYPDLSTDRFVVTVARKSFRGNDVAQLLLAAKAHAEKKGKTCAGCGHFLPHNYFENGSDRCYIC